MEQCMACLRARGVYHIGRRCRQAAGPGGRTLRKWRTAQTCPSYNHDNRAEITVLAALRRAPGVRHVRRVIHTSQGEP